MSPQNVLQSLHGRRTVSGLAVIFALNALVFSSNAFAADAGRRQFDFPADVAERSLKSFSLKSGAEVVFATSTVGKVRTNEVRGSYTPREVLDRLVAGTGLMVEQNPRTGALMVARDSNARTPRKTAQVGTGGRPKQERTTPSTNPSSTNAAGLENDKPVVMSPFEVDASGQRGYYSPNVMSGTRLNAKIEDLASSISVVTKEQMADFAMVDINDIFAYEASTEGMGNYTDYEINASGVSIDNSMIDPANANRIRGVGRANISQGNFETSGRVPIDPIAIDAVEISRGPNSTIFGLGNPSGTVNMVPSSANLSRHRSQVQFRADSWDGHRASLDVNRVLKPGKLAVRGSAVFQHDSWVRKPSGTDTVRLNGMVKFQPFESTSVTASYSHYRIEGKRPNNSMPRDTISNWLEAGAQTWDPLTATRYLNGVPVQVGDPLPASSGLISLFQSSGRGETQLHVNGDGSIGFWTPSRGTTLNTPDAPNQTGFYYTQTRRPDLRSATQPLFTTDPPVSGKEYYDWTSINLAAMNSFKERTATSTVTLEQFFLNTPTHVLAAQLGWFREDSNNKNRYFYGKPSTSFTPNFLHINTNTRLLTGRPNPYFLRPYISMTQTQQDTVPLLRDTYRGQLAYKLDFTSQKSWIRWLGMHQLSGYGEYRDYKTWSFPTRDAIVSVHSWAPATDPRGVSGLAGDGYNIYHQFYVGDDRGYNVDYAPSDYRYGIYPYTWGNALTGQIVENVQLGAASTSSTGTGSGSRRLQRTQGGVFQNHLLKGRIVTTFGTRRDENFTRSTTGTVDWVQRQGRTTTAGVVVKPLKWLYLHVNTSDSFIPSTLAQNLQGELVPDPRGEGEDYGFTLNLFGGKLNIRANQYENRQINARSGPSTSVAGTIRVFDAYQRLGQEFGLDYWSRNWSRSTFRKKGIEPTEEQLDARVAEIMQIPTERLRMLQRAVPLSARALDKGKGGVGDEFQIPLVEPAEALAKGKEIEINFNPNNFWTIRMNVTEQETIDSKMTPALDAYIAERMPVWTSIIDEDKGTPYWTSVGYNVNAPGTQTPQSYYNGTIAPRLPIIKATEGKSRPEVRKYRVNLSQNFRLTGITDHRILKRFNIGGAARWEDKGSIGYYGVQEYPAVITAFDPNRPIWDKAHLYIDLFAGYRTRLFSDRVGATFQLNVRNVEEGGRLQAISAFPNGAPSNLRIVEPRQFILTATFDL